MIRFLCALPAAIFLGVPVLAGGVWTVSHDGTGDFYSLDAAYDVASDGDVIYLYDLLPYFGDLVLDGKGVTIINTDPGFRADSVTIRNIPAQSEVILRGVDIPSGSGLLIEDCDGPVLCTDFANQGGSNGLIKGIHVRRSAAVSLRRMSFSMSGYNVATIEDSNVTIEDCDLVGLDGADGYSGSGFCMTCCGGGGNGAAALVVGPNSTVRVHGGRLVGGRGGWGPGTGTCDSGSDSPAVLNLGPGSTVTLVRTATMAPLPNVGTIQTIHMAAPSASPPASVPSGTVFAVDVRGVPGETIYALVSSALGFDPQDPFVGVLEVSGVQRRIRLGSLPASGTRSVYLNSPGLPTGVTRTLGLQFALQGPTGQLRLASAEIVHVLGAGIPNW